jgi:hypothetical protein
MEPDERHVAAFESPDPTGRTTAKISGDTAVDLSIDLSTERPHATGEALRPDRSMRWLGAAMAGVAVVLLAIVGIVRATDDSPPDAGTVAASSDVPRLEPQLREPLQTLVIGMETIRLESMTAEFIRNTDRPLARVSRRPTKPTPTATPASGARRPRTAEPAVTERPAHPSGNHRGDAPPSFSALPAPPPSDTPPADAPALSEIEPPPPVEDEPPASPPSPS